MADPSGIQPGAISRRSVLLRGVACAAGAATLIEPTKNAQTAKMPQTSPAVAYQSTPKDSRKCDGYLVD